MTDSKTLNNLGVLIIQNIKLLQISELKINMENMLFRRIISVLCYLPVVWGVVVMNVRIRQAEGRQASVRDVRSSSQTNMC